MSKRFRLFAGPNGSGKSTLIKEVRETVNVGFFVNADEIEDKLKTQKYLLLEDYSKSQLTQEDWTSFLINYPHDTRFDGRGFPSIKINENILTSKTEVDSYGASLIAEFLRVKLLTANANFSFETVMSHHSKVDFLKQAKECGFKTYLYFICTQDPAINMNRVYNRVHMGGHGVEEGIIKDRYYRSLGFLSQAFLLADRAFIMDNSNISRDVILEKDGPDIIFYTTSIPEWVDEHLMAKLKLE